MKVASAYRFDPSPLPERKRRFIHCDREGGGDRLYRDYFAPEPVCGPHLFRRRFRTRRELLLRIVNVLEIDHFFQQRPDAVGRFGFSPIQKYTAALRQLAYGTSADCCDEYLRIGESTVLSCLKKFCKAGEPTIILEAIASQDLWIWHAFFGVAGSNNDINVLNQSTLFNDVLLGNESAVHFVANNFHHTRGYYLTDGIYPNWSVFVKSFTYSGDKKKRRFKLMLEAARKDVERAFGVLQARWDIIKGGIAADWDGDADGGESSSVPQTEFNTRAPSDFAAFMARSSSMKDTRLHARLRDDLVEHIWARFGPIEP
ncbi:uncharacterized protein LOC130993788 [Salvia miltiorrhiza]|uniref:uncharacterized protein LOC130993788 n=1 Tax=Salvia miltiorrhiza TaxID=226208 RepID=UPI0025AD5EFD|nr:uncharacterized protein LOC130993788 [Salvia miltiorrhiza]